MREFSFLLGQLPSINGFNLPLRIIHLIRLKLFRLEIHLVLSLSEIGLFVHFLLSLVISEYNQAKRVVYLNQAYSRRFVKILKHVHLFAKVWLALVFQIIDCKLTVVLSLSKVGVGFIRILCSIFINFFIG